MTKTIPQLTAATLPVDPASLVEISIPGGGSRKLALSDLISNLTVESLDVEITGNWINDLEPLFITIPAWKIELFGTVFTIPGAWMEQLSFPVRQPGITHITFPNLGGLVNDLNAPGMANLISMNFPVLQFLEHFNYREDYGVLTSFDFSALKAINDSFIYDGQSIDVLPSIALPSLLITNNFNLQNSAIAILDVSALKFVANNFLLNTVPNLVTLDLGALIYGSVALSSVNSLTTLNLSSLETLGQIIVNASALTTVTFGALKQNSSNTNFSGCALSQASVDGILVALAALDGTGGTTSYDNFTIDLSGGTNASPGATGLTAKATLEGRGNTVTVN
jgi:hypothetical protein